MLHDVEYHNTWKKNHNFILKTLKSSYTLGKPIFTCSLCKVQTSFPLLKTTTEAIESSG